MAAGSNRGHRGQEKKQAAGEHGLGRVIEDEAVGGVRTRVALLQGQVGDGILRSAKEKEGCYAQEKQAERVVGEPDLGTGRHNAAQMKTDSDRC